MRRATSLGARPSCPRPSHNNRNWLPSPWSDSMHCRSNSTATKSAPNKSYSNTLLLPKTKFKPWPDYASRDTTLGKKTNEELYAWQWENNTGPVFVFHDGPPYANGALHMGHAMNKILKDMINRFQVLQGRRVHYRPGWDCHGLPIEIKTLEQLKAAPNTLPAATVRKEAEKFARKQIKSQMAEFQKLSIMASWTEKETYRTIDRDYEIRQLRLLQDLVRKNLIYRRHRPVFWSPSSHSALAEAEVNYVEDHTSRSAYVTFRVTSPPGERLHQIMCELEEGEELNFLIWTTTPWTLPANMGIAVNPNMEYSVVRLSSNASSDKRPRVVIVGSDLIDSLRTSLGDIEPIATLSGQDLVGTIYTSTFHSPIPLTVLPSHHVTSTSGTGVVHMAPGHGAEDYAAFLASGHSLSSVVCPVNDAGEYSKDILELVKSGTNHGERLVGKSVLGEGGNEAVRILEECGVLVKEQPHKHRYPYDNRMNKPMIIRATSQWFCDVTDTREDALNALKSVKFYPESARSRLESFIKTRTEWCISRQRVWGSPIPSLHDTSSNDVILTAESLDHIISILEVKGVGYWWTGDVEEFLPPSLKGTGRTFRKGTDTIDVWFDSGSSWTMLRDIEGGGEFRSGGVRPADACLEGSDQHRGWFQSLLLTAVASGDGVEAATRAPFKSLVSHGFVLDECGRKMSKSLGNIMSPTTVISGGKDLKKEPAYGVDVLRYWAAGVDYSKDVSVGPAILAQVQESVRKLRNTAKFMLSNLGDRRLDPKDAVSKGDMTMLDRYVMLGLYRLERTCRESYENHNFHEVVQTLNAFTNTSLSALYFDVTKDVLYADDVSSTARRSVVTVLDKVLDVYTSILAPIVPQLAEEIHEKRSASTTPTTSVFASGWQSVDEQWNDSEVAQAMIPQFQLRDVTLRLLENARRDGRIRSALEASVDIRPSHTPNESDAGAQLRRTLDSSRAAEQLASLFIVSYVNTSTAPGSILSTDSLPWHYTDDLHGFTVTVSPSPNHKCPRCWQYTAPAEEHLCNRCEGVVKSLP